MALLIADISDTQSPVYRIASISRLAYVYDVLQFANSGRLCSGPGTSGGADD